MKLSSKLKTEIKEKAKKTLIGASLIASTLAIFKLADMFMPLSEKLNAINDETTMQTATATEGTTFKLNVVQEYMNVGETLQLSVSTSISSTNITWAVDSESVATVDSNGKVTAVGDGYTTVYATDQNTGMQAMAIINVAKQGAVAYAQVSSGNQFTVVLKEDGTVWVTGRNSGGLGDGTTGSTTYPVQVKINETTYLTNVVKIAAGYSHALALTADGKLYAWGDNGRGNLGTGNKTNMSYATRVVGVNGVGYLENIVDMACGTNENSYAIDKYGTVYTWGYACAGYSLGVSGTSQTNTPLVIPDINGVSVVADGATDHYRKCSSIRNKWKSIHMGRQFERAIRNRKYYISKNTSRN